MPNNFKIALTALVLFLSPILYVLHYENTNLYGYAGGWSQKLVQRIDESDSMFQDLPPDWVGSGEGETRLLYRDYLLVTGRQYTPRRQGDAPSCVGHAAAAAIDFLAVAEISNGEPERAPAWLVDASTIYGLSRQEIANLGISTGGSTCQWACRAMNEYGLLFRRDYSLLGIDLTFEDPNRDRQYGRYGVPDSLEPVARLHPILAYIQLDRYEELRDAIYQGCPVIIGSSQGFGERFPLIRDAEGFLNPPRRGNGRYWYHAMVVIGVADNGRKGALFLNSWGENWIEGPDRFADCPKGTFFVDAEIVDRMVKQGDAFAVRSFVGFPYYRLWRPL